MVPDKVCTKVCNTLNTIDLRHFAYEHDNGSNTTPHLHEKQSKKPIVKKNYMVEPKSAAKNFKKTRSRLYSSNI